MSRTFTIDGLDQPISPNNGGLFFKRHANSTHTVISGAKLLYDYNNNDHPNI
jgi:hypothetical protein